MNHSFTVILEREKAGGFHAWCPALRGCHTEAETEEEAMANIREAIALYLESLRAHGEEVPAESLTMRSVQVAA